ARPELLAALSLPWSSSPVEGHITSLKLNKARSTFAPDSTRSSVASSVPRDRANGGRATDADQTHTTPGHLNSCHETRRRITRDQRESPGAATPHALPCC